MVPGKQVDAWGAFIPERGDLEEKLKTGVIGEVKKRELPDLSVSIEDLGIARSTLESLFQVGEAREYIFFNQKLDSSANATVALRIAKRGANDLGLSWRLFEGNLNKEFILGLSQGGTVILGVCIFLAGVLTAFFGVGLFLMGAGVGVIGIGMKWWGKTKDKSKLNIEQKLDSRVLAQTIDYCLMSQLEELGVSANELRVTQNAQIEGIGKLE